MKGDVQAMYEVGLLLGENDQGTKAQKLVEAAMKGDVQAMYEVGLLLGETSSYSILNELRAPIDQGTEFLKKAADRKHVRALCVLGNIAEKVCPDPLFRTVAYLHFQMWCV